MSASMPAPEPLPSLPLIQARGPKLFAGGEEIRLRGTNLGNWLLQEDFMFGLYGTHSQMRGAMEAVLGSAKASAFWDEYETVFFTAADAKFLAAQGFNVLRVPLNQNRFEDPNRPGQYDEIALRRVDAVIRVCREHGLYVMLDLHAVPGGQSREIYADSPWATPDFWRHADFRKRAADFWVALARRYKDETAVAGYDLINEPNTEGSPRLLMDWYRELIPRIRAIDPAHLIWIVADDYGLNFLGLTDDLFSDKQIVYQFHLYSTFIYPFAKMTAYPQTVDGVSYDLDWLRRRLREQIEFGLKRPVALGEFGLSINRPFVPLMQAALRDFIRLCELEGWSWMQWSYKDVGQMGLVSPAPETPWKRFLAAAEVRACEQKAHEFFSVRAQAVESGNGLENAIQGLATNLEPEARRRSFRTTRRVLDGLLSQAIVRHLKDKDEAELRELARSFAFESCRPNAVLMDVYGPQPRAQYLAATALYTLPFIISDKVG